MGKLGEELLIVGITVKGDISPQEVNYLTAVISKKIGMTLAPGGTLCSYPTDEDKGGEGFTFFQPITESFICWDVWDDLEGAYLVICSCKMFYPQDAVDALKGLGLDVTETKFMKLRLNARHVTEL
jgi:hypothetical protein